MELQKRTLAPIEQEIKNIVRFVAQGRGSDALSLELERLEVQKRQIEEELERIGLEAREIENRSLNAKVIQEGLGLFGEIWEEATPEERKELMRFYIYKIIFTPAEIKMGLHTRPIFTENVESTVTGNHGGTGAVNRLNWLPGLVSQSVLLWDGVRLEMKRSVKGHISISLLSQGIAVNVIPIYSSVR